MVLKGKRTDQEAERKKGYEGDTSKRQNRTQINEEEEERKEKKIKEERKATDET